MQRRQYSAQYNPYASAFSASFEIEDMQKFQLDHFNHFSAPAFSY
jgi:hypothetical protein